ncbi:cupin domain-containing protein [Streptomyces sp. CB01881]|uniref:cupin domain-containing protein n=1 Tax=Streptomyces sp. CB01881 TaxID=2078691 RepID=UPI000CDC91AA|nr:cupin domain-containing protein [Streptomyces sp. CB01881]AUY51971.1 cupin [Streptomyces sp. CB01881]TYC71402.1 cupin domain-containing protein [Streptomyces sp. CB01881]
MTVIRSTEARRTETPNAVMTTLASPTQGGTTNSLWRVEMKEGGQGPLHVFDAEQIWTVVSGGATVELGDDTLAVAAGDTVVLPAGVARRITAEAAFSAVVTAPGGARVFKVGDPEEDRFTPGWIA